MGETPGFEKTARGMGNPPRGPWRRPDRLGEQTTVAQGGQFPAGDAVALKHGRKDKVDHILLVGAEAAWSGDDGNVVLVADHQ